MHHKVIILQYFSKKEDFYIEEVRNSLKGKVRKLKSMQHGGSLKVPYQTWGKYVYTGTIRNQEGEKYYEEQGNVQAPKNNNPIIKWKSNSSGT